jgi:hypothetical protein
LKKLNLLKIASASVLAIAGMSAQAAGPDWSLIITGPGIVVPAAPVQVAPVRVAPVVTSPVTSAPAIQTQNPQYGNVVVEQRYNGRDNNWEQERGLYDRRIQERENYYLERERAFIAREKAFLEREKQRQLVVENNMKASSAINTRQDQQLDLIVQGVNAGGIDKNEFISLMAQQKIIRDRESSFLADGFLSQEEYQALNTDLNNAEQAIRFASRPDRSRRDSGERERIYFPQNR